MKKALLILVGGRQTANVLTALHLRPDIIVPIVSHEAVAEGREWSQVKAELHSICPDGLQQPIPIDAFNIEEIRRECESAVNRFPNAEWIFNLTCGSKIMGFGAFDVAKEITASAWYLTEKRRVITLCGNQPSGDLFEIDVENYFAGYGRKCIFSNIPSDEILDFAKELAKSPANAMKFRDTLRNSNFSTIKKEQTKTAKLTAQAIFIGSFCQKAKEVGLVKDFQKLGSTFQLTVEGCDLWNFFNGYWLEYFVYAAAKEADCFDNVRFGVKIPNETGTNELDLAATSAGTLLLAECKTEKDFKTENLDKISSVANLVGGNYVGRVFITSNIVNEYDKDLIQSFEAFRGQAQARRIVVVTGKELMSLSQILLREVSNPTFQRG